MTELRQRSISQPLVFLAICFGAALLGLVLGKNEAVTAQAQQSLSQRSNEQKPNEKIIERTEFPNEPFRFGNLMVKSLKITASGKFSATSVAQSGGPVDDWLEDLEFTLENTSDKRITYVDVELDFPETKGDRPMMVVNQLGIGIPPYASGDRLKQTTPLLLDPGQTITFTLSAQRLQMIKDFLALGNFHLTDLNRVVIRVGYLVFEDGRKWQIGRFYKPNPNAPGGYERINQ
jgi:hypothetical protein